MLRGVPAEGLRARAGRRGARVMVGMADYLAWEAKR